MDRLHQEVSALVAEATEAGEDARDTLTGIRALALARAGRARAEASGVVRQAAAGAEEAAARRRRVPRLTEPWFC